MVALGGEPTATARQVLAAEQQATKDYTARAKQAEDLGDKVMAVQLEDENGGAKLDHRAANRSCFWAE